MKVSLRFKLFCLISLLSLTTLANAQLAKCPTLNEIKVTWNKLNAVHQEKKSIYVVSSAAAVISVDTNDWFIVTSPIRAGSSADALSAAQQNIRDAYHQRNTYAYVDNFRYVCDYYGIVAPIQMWAKM